MNTAEQQLAQIREENAQLRRELEEAQDALNAIYSGEVDALVVNTAVGDQIFSLQSADYSYRLLIESMQEGAVTLSEDKSVLYANRFVEKLLGIPLEILIGSEFSRFVHESDLDGFGSLLRQQGLEHGSASAEVRLTARGGGLVPVKISVSRIFLENIPVYSMVVTDLSMHKRHEQMLAEEQLSRNIIRQSVNAIIVCDERGFVIRANKAAADLIGSSCLNLPFNDVFHISMQDPAEEEKCPAARETPGQGELLKIEHIIAGRTYYSCEASIHRQNDEVEHLSLSASPMADDAGQVIGAVINIADISLQKRTEQVLREQNDYIQTILDNLPIGLAVSYLEDGTATYINKRFEEIYGWPAEELRNTEMFYEKVYPDPAYRQYMKSRIEADRASGDLERMYWKNVEITRKDGSRRIVSAKNIPIFDQNFMISTVQDDTQQAAAERKLEENEEKYRLIAENTVDCIWILDMDFNFTFVNQAVQTMFGYTPEEFVQTNLRDHCSEEAFRQLQKLVEEKSSGVPGGRAEPGKAELVFEANLRSRSGQSVSVEMHGAVIFDADGRASALQCVTRDVRERNSLEQRLRQAQKMEAVGRLAGGVAHDYNNMLSVILGYTEMAMDQLAKDDPLYGDLNEVLSAANRSRDITRQLLAFARKQTIAPVVLDLNKTISGMLNMVQRLIGEDIALEWHPGEELPPINMDPSQIKTEVFFLPAAVSVEKEGSISNSGRWLQWRYAGPKPKGDCIPDGDMALELWKRIRELYAKEGGAFPEPIMNFNKKDIVHPEKHFPHEFDPHRVAKLMNGYFVKDVTIGDNTYKAGTQVPSFVMLQADGSTASGNWLHCGSYTEAGNMMARRDKTQTEMQANIGLFPNWSWCWPVNRRVLYNRASVNLEGKPYAPNKAVIAWDGSKWVGDVPDGGWKPGDKHPFIMSPGGFGQLYGPGLQDGPFPEFYEALECPFEEQPFSKQLHNPTALQFSGEKHMVCDPRYPFIGTTYRVTEHWQSGVMTRWTPWLLECEPQQFAEIDPEMAKLRGIENGDKVVVESLRGQVEAVAIVTPRIQPFTIQGQTLHMVGLPWHYGWVHPKNGGDSANLLTPSAGDPNTGIPETKAFMVNIRKA